MQTCMEQRKPEEPDKVSGLQRRGYTTLLYGSETWVAYRSYMHFLLRFHQRCLRTILSIRWIDFITNVEVLEQSAMISVEAILLMNQLVLAGHASRIEDQRLPKIAPYGEVSTGHRDWGDPKKCNKDCQKKSRAAYHADPLCWSDMAADRDAWRHSIFRVVNKFEQDKRNAQRDKRSKRKGRAMSSVTLDVTFTCGQCAQCARPCHSRIGLLLLLSYHRRLRMILRSARAARGMRSG